MERIRKSQVWEIERYVKYICINVCVWVYIDMVGMGRGNWDGVEVQIGEGDFGEGEVVRGV